MPSVDRHMSRDLLTVEAGVPVVAVARRMADRNVGAVLVLEEGRLAGIMTERDLLRAVARGLRDDTVVGECMTADPDTIAPDDTIEHAAVLMIHGAIAICRWSTATLSWVCSRSATWCRSWSRTRPPAARDGAGLSVPHGR